VPRYGKWIADTRSACASHRKVISTDIRKYYPSIPPSILLDSISVAVPDVVVRTLDRLLTPWWKDGLRGLPIGPEISGVIGDALLVPMDEALEESCLRAAANCDEPEVQDTAQWMLRRAA
jgi:hypothetical protein